MTMETPMNPSYMMLIHVSFLDFTRVNIPIAMLVYHLYTYDLPFIVNIPLVTNN